MHELELLDGCVICAEHRPRAPGRKTATPVRRRTPAPKPKRHVTRSPRKPARRRVQLDSVPMGAA